MRLKALTAAAGGYPGQGRKGGRFEAAARAMDGRHDGDTRVPLLVCKVKVIRIPWLPWLPTRSRRPVQLVQVGEATESFFWSGT